MSSWFLNPLDDETKVLIVGQDRENGASLMVLNQHENIEINAVYKEDSQPVGQGKLRINDACLIKTQMLKVKNLVAVTNRGEI